MSEDMELFACLFRKPLNEPTEKQIELLELIEREGPLTIKQMKESTGWLVKDITPILHRLQEAFLVYEDQYDGEWDRGWYKFYEMFPNVDFTKYSRHDALKIMIKRFAYRHVLFDAEMVKSFYKLPMKEIVTAIEELATENVITAAHNGYLLKSDFDVLEAYSGENPQSVFTMHRNDFLARSYEHLLKNKYQHNYPDTLYYLLIDGVFRGAVVGKFRYTPEEIEDVILELPKDETATRKDEILKAIHNMCGKDNLIKRYQGKFISCFMILQDI